MNQIMHTQACKICPVHVAQDHERVWREISPRVLEESWRVLVSRTGSNHYLKVPKHRKSNRRGGFPEIKAGGT